MVDSVMGTRIAERRRNLGVTQAEMARRIGISPSYLNLIERNKRRIAGALLNRTAQELGVRTDDLDGAPERRLAEDLREIAALPILNSLDVEHHLVPELIARFPGWARALAALARSEQAARDTSRALSDRLAHDPFLGETVHGMLSRVTAIRSAGEILTEFQDMPGSERDEFLGIIHGEAQALTGTGEALANYLGQAEEAEARLTPIDEVEAFFAAAENHFEAIEHAEDVEETIETILGAAPQIETEIGRARAQDRLRTYAADAEALPMTDFLRAASDKGYDIEALADKYTTSVDTVCRRLASIPPAVGGPHFGYFLVNASGTIIQTMALPGLTAPRYAATCPLWVLFRAQQQPEVAMAQHVEMPNGDAFVFIARARPTGAVGFGKPRHFLTDMLCLTAKDARTTVYAPKVEMAAEPVGPACRICPRTACEHRVADPLTG